MAFRLSYWILGVALGCGTLAVLALPPRTTPLYGEAFVPDRERTAESVRARRLTGQATLAAERLRRLAWMDALAPRAAVGGARGLPVVVGAPPEIPAQDVEALGARVAAELERLASPRPSVDLGVFVVPALGDVPEPNRFLHYPDHLEWYAGSHGGRPYCITLLIARVPGPGTLERADGWRPLRDGLTNVLGPCGFHARYGPPGAGTAAWLERTGAAYAQGRAFSVEGLGTTTPTTRGRGRFGVRVGDDRGFGQDLRVARCARGDQATCATLALTRTGRPGDEGAAVGDSLRLAGLPFLGAHEPGWNPFQLLGHGMLDRLERELGGEAFAALWRADDPFPEAFERALGAPLGAWVREWVAESLPGQAAGDPTLPSARELLTALLWAGLAVAAAVAVLRRRRVA